MESKIIVMTENEVSQLISKAIKPIQNQLQSLIKEKVYSVKQAAEYLNKSTPTIYKLCAQGEIKAKPRNKGFMITHTSLMEYINPIN